MLDLLLSHASEQHCEYSRDTQNSTIPSHCRRVVLLAVDESEHSELAVAWATSNVVKPSDHVHVVTALSVAPGLADASWTFDLQHHSGAPRTCNPVLSSEMAANARARWEKEKADHMDHAKGVLQHYANQLCPCAAKVSQPTDDTSSALETQAVCTTNVICSDMKPGPALVKYAEEIKADLVVVGSRGLGSTVRKILGVLGLGSVSDYLVHHLHCPALVVKTQHNHTH
mmetsp:Transcript_33091/g.63534  ORF Transcript_33091/g.63534 Transcript_33091/m.63534 type:complete len:228 (+) Transcript_33091:201-884(+)|eukprot:CAMPEP_0114230952 /NCGR_PEP_ID=MMETSP0058-20121206/3761_1 /TAXON_ID=36894 /ORGANISM="Pyramimonas parkeae, CCMP726" /LENGTH=227 /DNA_ID=CAMNT_0001342221 /DNA_START=172 /DNA_END=855 /DNA_ORIENTATION=+